MRLRWFWVLLPVVLGTILALILFLTDFDNSLLYAQADLGSILFGLGVIASILTALVIIVLEQLEKIQINATIEFAENRRRFLRRLDHELKNPLTAILAGLANLSILEDSDARAVTLESVSNQVDRMRKLVADLAQRGDHRGVEQIDNIHPAVDLFPDDFGHRIALTEHDGVPQLVIDCHVGHLLLCPSGAPGFISKRLAF